VCPVDHQEHVVSDVSVDEHLQVQRVVHRVGRALTEVIETERLYVLSFGSQDANRHVHWHLVPLPPGVPYEDQQVAALHHDRGHLAVTDADQARLAEAIRAALG
jgi:diadenosine tetraphosphate (Ap4A) HIT family hydrolase